MKGDAEYNNFIDMTEDLNITIKHQYVLEIDRLKKINKLMKDIKTRKIRNDQLLYYDIKILGIIIEIILSNWLTALPFQENNLH